MSAAKSAWPSFAGSTETAQDCPLANASRISAVSFTSAKIRPSLRSPRMFLTRISSLPRRPEEA